MVGEFSIQFQGQQYFLLAVRLYYALFLLKKKQQKTKLLSLCDWDYLAVFPFSLFYLLTKVSFSYDLFLVCVNIGFYDMHF